MKNLRYSLLSLLLVAGCTQNDSMVDLLVTNAKIWTGNTENPWAEVMAISGDEIVFVGTAEEAQTQGIDGAEELDAGGRLVTPGFIDSHVHFLFGGENLGSVQLRDASSPEDFIQRIGEFAKGAEPGTWITGGDWDHENWGGELPHRSWIDSVTQNNPVMLNRLDGHMILANSAAMTAANVDASVEDVEGGEITRDSDGQPTGIFKDNAMLLISDARPPSSQEQKILALKAAMGYAASYGVTSVHDVDGFTYSEAYESLNQAGELKTRVYAIAPLPNWEALKQHITSSGIGDKWVRYGGLKGFVDGSLGSHTAAFFKDFDDAPGERGFFINDAEDLYTWTKDADAEGLHVVIHAIGDSANHTLLNIFEKVATENGPRDRRFRIEHAQHLATTDIPRFGQLGVIPSMQPYHAIDDGRWAEKIIGPERIQTTYAFADLLNAGATLAFGSDWFVAPAIPLYGIYAAVTRQTLDDKNPDGWVPSQKITVEQALKAYTVNAAYASFEEDLKGALEVGKLADFVVLSQDIFEIDPVEIRNTEVVMTYVGGKQVYSSE